MAPQKHDARQLLIDFTSPLKERLAEIRSLETLKELGYPPPHIDTIIDLLTRVAMASYGKDWIERQPIELANLPTLRKVSERTVQVWTSRAELLGVVEVDRPSTRFGGHRKARWRVLYPEIREVITRAQERAKVGGEVGVKRGCSRGAESAPPGGEESAPLIRVNYLNTSGPVPETGPELFEGDHGGSTGPSGFRREYQPPAGARDLGRVAQQPKASNGSAASPGRDDVREELVKFHELLRVASLRRVAPLPPGDCLGNVFKPLTLATLTKPALLAEWFRRASGVPDPLLSDTVADLLLVFAAAIYIKHLKPGEVNNRVGVFVSVLFKRKWRQIVDRLGHAAACLEKLERELPECLTHPEGLGPRAQPAQTHEEVQA